MGTLRTISGLVLALGLASLAYAGLQGDLDVFLVVVVPVVTGSGPFAALGMLATIAGLFGVIASSATTTQPRGPGGLAGESRGPHSEPRDGRPLEEDEERERRSQTRGGGVILLGPIPIAWGSDEHSLKWLVVLGAVLTLLAIGLFWLARPS